MKPTLYLQLSRLARWPRRIAAVLCLLLAAASALSAERQPSAAATRTRPADARAVTPAGLADRLAVGQVAVPVTLADSSARYYLHAGDRVDLYATNDAGLGAAPTSTQLATAVEVVSILTVSPAATDAEGTHVVVAAGPVAAARVAAAGGQAILAVVDKYP